MGKRTYVSDMIGDEYKGWNRGNIIFIKTPTGSGKTTFILGNLLEYAVSTDSKILYLVNRTILRDQIIKKIEFQLRFDFPDIDDILTVKTYQEIEAECKNNLTSVCEKSSIYKYIVADECHYFLCDSNFNTNTKLSYDYIKSKRGNSVLIFMSATIENIEKIISGRKNETQDKEINSETKRKISFELSSNDVEEKVNDYEIISYDADADYSYVKLNILKDVEEIFERISEDKGKWLIFVDSVKIGESINRALLKLGLDSVFIDSEKKNNDQDIKEMVKDVTKDEKFKQKIIIATSVMDNGISISDIELRNVVIMACTKEEFLQMLGRVRMDMDQNDTDNNTLNLYIFMRSKGFFTKKLLNIERRLENVAKYKKYTVKMEEVLKMQSIKCSLEKEIKKSVNHGIWINIREHTGYMIDYYKSEKSLNNILDKALRSDGFYDFVKHSCIVIDDAIVLNNFSDQQYKCAYDAYREIIDEFDKEGDYAFVKQQAEWLEIENINDIIKESKKDKKEIISSLIDEYVGEEFDKEKNFELRERIRIPARDLIKQCEKPDNSQDREPIITELGKVSSEKNPRTLTPNNFNTIMNILDLKYEMEQNKNRKYIIKKKQ